MSSFDDLKRINLANSILNRSNISMGLRPMYLHEEIEEEQVEEDYVEPVATLEEELIEPEAKSSEDFAIEEVEINLEEKDKALSDKLRMQIKEKLEEAALKDLPEEEPDFILEQTVVDIEEDNYQYEEAFHLEEKLVRPETNLNFDHRINNKKAPSFSKTVLLTSFGVIAAVFLVFAFKPVSTASDERSTDAVIETKLQELTKNVNTKGPQSLIITSGNFLNEKEALRYKDSLTKKLGVPLKLVKADETYSIQVGPAYSKHEDALIVFDELSRYSVSKLSIKVAS